VVKNFIKFDTLIKCITHADVELGDMPLKSHVRAS